MDSDQRRLKNFVLEDKLWREFLATSEQTDTNWKDRWGWLLKEYEDMSKGAQEMTKASSFLKAVNKHLLKKEDDRSIHPVPLTTNDQYGWICYKPKFELDKYGPDVTIATPLPEIYKLLHD